jgi:hypothetical protein
MIENFIHIQEKKDLGILNNQGNELKSQKYKINIFIDGEVYQQVKADYNQNLILFRKNYSIENNLIFLDNNIPIAE